MAYLLALVAVFLWSTNAFVASKVLVFLPVEQVQLLQFLGAALVFLIFRVSTPKKKRVGISVDAWVLGAVGLCGTMIFQYIAFSIGPITQTNIVAYAWPLLTALITIYAGKSEYSRQLAILAVLGFVGVTLVISDGQFDFAEINVYGFSAAVASALCMAIFSVGIGASSQPAHNVLLAGSFIGVPLTLVWCLVGKADWSSLVPVLLGLYLGVGPMGVGYLFWSWAMQRDKNGNASILGFLTPICSTGLLLITGAVLGLWAFVGAVLVLSCCALIGVQAWWKRHA